MMNKKIKQARVLAIDIDGTLTHDIAYTNGEVMKARPNKKVIEVVNKLAEFKFIIVYTARRYERAEATLRWLDKHGVRYHAISFRKTPCDCYIDDKVIDVKEIFK